MKNLSRILTTLFILSLLLGGAAGCSNQSGESKEHAYTIAPLHTMPGHIQNAAATVREAYQFATFNQEVLEALPCYCGCGPMGHTSNYSCYIAGRDEDGAAIYDNHALGCQICVDITQDAMRMLDDGKSMAEIADYVNSSYSRFGPPTSFE